MHSVRTSGAHSWLSLLPLPFTTGSRSVQSLYHPSRYRDMTVLAQRLVVLSYALCLSPLRCYHTGEALMNGKSLGSTGIRLVWLHVYLHWHRYIYVHRCITQHVQMMEIVSILHVKYFFCICSLLILMMVSFTYFFDNDGILFLNLPHSFSETTEQSKLSLPRPHH